MVQSDKWGLLAETGGVEGVKGGQINLVAGSEKQIISKDTTTAAIGSIGLSSTVTLNFKYNNIISPSTAVYARRGGEVTIVSTEETDIEETDINGDILAKWDGKINVSFANKESNLTGKVITVYTDDKGVYYEDTATNLKLSDEASWTMTGNSNVTNPGIDKAFIYMTANEKGNASTLTVDKAQTGSGTIFAIDLDATNRNNKAASTTSDYIYLNGSSEGVHYIDFDVEASGLATDMSVNDKLYFAYVADAAVPYVDGDAEQPVVPLSL